jgi:hypothetical protein
MAIPHKTAPFPKLGAVVTMPADRLADPADAAPDGRRRRRRR